MRTLLKQLLFFISKFYWVYLLILVSLGHFLVDLMIGVWPVYKSIMHIDLVTAGLIAGLGGFIGESAQVLFGTLGDRGYRQLLMVIGLVASISSAFFIFTTQPLFLFGLYLLASLGSGCFHPAATGFVSTLSLHPRSLFIAIFSMAGSFGLASSQLVFSSTYHYFEGKTYLLAIPLLLLACILGGASLISFSSQTKSETCRIRDSWQFFKIPDLKNLYFAQVASQSILCGTIFILPDCLKAFGYSGLVTYGGGHACLIIGGACMLVPAGYLAEKYSCRQVMKYATCLASVLFYLFIFFGSYSVLFLLPCLFLLGACLFIINPIGVSLGISLQPNHPSAMSAYLMGLVWCVSEVLGPGGVGVLTYFFESYASIKSLAILGSLFFFQLLFILLLSQKASIGLDFKPKPIEQKNLEGIT